MEQKSNKESRRQAVISWAVTIAAALALALFINNVLIVNASVPTGSMESTIMTGSRMFGLRVSYWGSDPVRGDIIIFRYPDDPSRNFVKRVIGMPGDTVEIIGGVTYVNGEKLEESYLNETPAGKDYGPYEVPEDSYFVMGDNRNHSNDSRLWQNTFVSRNAVLGKAVFCYWPLDRMGILE